jgi:hypothetical protein
LALNSTLYNCKGNPEIVTKVSSEPTISFHSSFDKDNTTKDALYDRKIDIATEGLELQYVNANNWFLLSTYIKVSENTE